MSAASAVVFGYHDVGVRCLRVLLGAGVDVRLVVTHEDDPAEARWFGSVAETAREHELECIAPARGDDPEIAKRLRERRPDFVFSFYYRQLLPAAVLEAPLRGAFNMHGSLLPRYRGRAPVNWAILRGERETGATLHHMVARADAGDLVDQQAVPILPDDDAREVMAKVTVAAEIVLARSLPGLIAGTAPRIPQRIDQGEYVGRRRPEDGRIDWSRPARQIHDLVRAVAPPFPGAFTELDGRRVWVHRTRVVAAPPGQAAIAAQLFGAAGRCLAACGDGGVLELRALADERGPIALDALARELARAPRRMG